MPFLGPFLTTPLPPEKIRTFPSQTLKYGTTSALNSYRAFRRFRKIITPRENFQPEFRARQLPVGKYTHNKKLSSLKRFVSLLPPTATNQPSRHPLLLQYTICQVSDLGISLWLAKMIERRCRNCPENTKNELLLCGLARPAPSHSTDFHD